MQYILCKLAKKNKSLMADIYAYGLDETKGCNLVISFFWTATEKQYMSIHVTVLAVIRFDAKKKKKVIMRRKKISTNIIMDP